MRKFKEYKNIKNGEESLITATNTRNANSLGLCSKWVIIKKNM